MTDKERNRLYYLRNRDKILERSRKWSMDNPAKRRAIALRWIRNNPEKHAASRRKWIENNQDKHRATKRAWSAANRDRACLYSVNRLKQIKRSTPHWLSKWHKDEMALIYSLKYDMQNVCGQVMEIDHIVPLQGKNVCGLHVPWNLRIVTRVVNRRKHNHLE